MTRIHIANLCVPVLCFVYCSCEVLQQQKNVTELLPRRTAEEPAEAAEATAVVIKKTKIQYLMGVVEMAVVVVIMLRAKHNDEETMGNCSSGTRMVGKYK